MENVEPKGRLLENKILVRPDKAEEKTASGIIIPTSEQEKMTQGEVIKVGPGLAECPMSVSKGDRVMYGKYSGTEVELEGISYMIIRETDIMYIL